MLVILGMLGISACLTPKGENIVGKWRYESYIENGEQDTPSHSIELTSEGKVIITNNGADQTTNGFFTYIISKNSIHFTQKRMALDGISTEKESMKFEISNERLYLTNKRNGISTLVRIKDE